MLSNQVLQSTVDGLKIISKVDFCVLDPEGKVLAYTFEKPEQFEKALALSEQPPEDGQEIAGFRFFKVFDGERPEYILIAAGGGEVAQVAGKMAAFQLSGLIAAYKEKYDTDNFIKNLLLDNLLQVDIYNRARKLHIDTDVKRVIYIIEAPEGIDGDKPDDVKALLGDDPKDFITAVDDMSVVVVKEIPEKNGSGELKDIAGKILDALRNGGGSYPRIAYGTVVSDIRAIPRSYREARLALDVGRIFFKDRDVSAYGALGIGRLIYQLPIPLCKMFIKEIFEGKPTEDFNKEMLLTADKFFENSLNVSKTSRQLYIHRNTLVYRLDKVQKASGLDLRVFEDAVTFKIALMVVQYMKYMESQEQ